MPGLGWASILQPLIGFLTFPSQGGLLSLLQLPFQFLCSSPLQFPLGSSIFASSLMQCLTTAYCIFSYSSLTLSLSVFELGSLWQLVLPLAIRTGFIQNIRLIWCFQKRVFIFTKKGLCDRNMGVWFGIFTSSAYIFLNFVPQCAFLSEISQTSEFLKHAVCLCAKGVLKPCRSAPSDGVSPASTACVVFLWALALRKALPGIAKRGWAQHRTPRNCRCWGCVTEVGGRVAVSKSPEAASVPLLAPFLFSGLFIVLSCIVKCFSLLFYCIEYIHRTRSQNKQLC